MQISIKRIAFGICFLILSCEEILNYKDGICVLENISNNSYTCYADTTEIQCVSDSDNSVETILYYWGRNYDCSQFCDEQIPDSICEIR